jgi:tetratricopeptide (TPR) repeat protein
MKKTSIALGLFLCLLIGLGVGIADVQAGSPPIPKDIETELVLAERHLRDNNPAAALETLEEIKDKGFGVPWFHFAMGHAQFAADRPEDALDSFNEAVSSAPLFAEAWNMIGLVNFRLNQYQAAKSAYQLALAIPDYETPEISATNLALVYYQNEEYQKALEQAKTAINKNSKFGGAYVICAQAHTKLGNNRAALDILKRGEEAAPDNADEMRRLAAEISGTKIRKVPEISSSTNIGTKDDVEISPRSSALSGGDDVRTEINRFVERWRRAWSNQDVNRYLSFYSRNFVPENNMSYARWSTLRKKRIHAPQFIEVNISDQQIAQYGDSKAYVTFDQKYRSEKFSDKVKKELILVKEYGEWRIIREHSF